MATNNLLPFNPTKANQETDAAYLADSTRTGGAGVDAIWPSASANKTLYQVAGFVSSFAQMMANKGFTMSDVDLASLTAQLGNVLTTADQRLSLQTFSYAPSITCDVSKYVAFQIPLTGAVSLWFTGQQVGLPVVLLFVQDSDGGRLVTWPSGVDGHGVPSTAAHDVSVQQFIVQSDLTLKAAGPMTSVLNGLVGTPIAQNLGLPCAANASFNNATVYGELMTESTVQFLYNSPTAPTPAPGDSSTKLATTAFVTGAFTHGSSGGVSWRKAPDGYVEQWANGVSLGGGDYTVSFTGEAVFTQTPNVQVTCVYPSGDTGHLSTNGESTSGFTIHQSDLTGMSANWRAAGY